MYVFCPAHCPLGHEVWSILSLGIYYLKSISSPGHIVSGAYCPRINWLLETLSPGHIIILGRLSHGRLPWAGCFRALQGVSKATKMVFIWKNRGDVCFEYKRILSDAKILANGFAASIFLNIVHIQKYNS